ncbi:MAG: phosphoribosylaminoimidazolesuccinocarboxamide synthase [Candidatus Aerophobetes bacterium]|nr:phosphoribosylaminoimidazolesuccinocarboxamide synthase [Candidatus Aerophobetes bacterium]
MKEEVIVSVDLSFLELFKRGKVRDLYHFDNKLLIVATDRISAFDVVLPEGIPCKGRVLTALSEFWFNFTQDIVPNHLITASVSALPTSLSKYQSLLEGRAMLVKKARRINIECVVRGYLAGSGWREYQKNGSVCGIRLIEGLQESERLPEPIFTPTTKASSGHDVSLTPEQMTDLIEEGLAHQLKSMSLLIYKRAAEYAESRGIIIADTKFEFGMNGEEVILIDEVLTPDSSRFWPKDEYQPGRAQESFDKQYVRDYLESLNWNKEPPAPHLPEEVRRKTSEKYLEAYKRITGKNLPI